MKPKIYFCLLLTSIFLTKGCNPSTPVANLQPQGSSLNPTAVPVNIRKKEVEKGNLVTNPSFELGRNYMSDTLKLSFNLPGWTKVGENVFWTNIENSPEYGPEDASNGIHAIKIIGEVKTETDMQGEGILSDYIRVIPGNYRLKMDLRLNNPESNLERLGTGVFDAVNIRLFCYDKNKVLIRNNYFHPGYDRDIDNSFKGFSFSNSREINDFGWSRIIARSGNFPFDEGNLPDGTRYVKIFIGLKGSGQLWVDWVDFRYATQNITLLEELSPLMDSTLEKIEYLLPRPQSAQYPKILDLTSAAPSGEVYKPVILIPPNTDRATLSIIRNFENSLRETGIYENRESIITSRVSQDDLENLPLIFSVGNTSLATAGKTLPYTALEGREQAYFLKRRVEDENVVYIGYTDYEGLTHAFHTITQLLSYSDLIYHHYDIIDFPWYTNRFLMVSQGSYAQSEPAFDLSSMQFLTRMGVNAWIAEPNKEVSGEITERDLQASWMSNLDKLRADFPYLRSGISLTGYRSAELLNTYAAAESINDRKLKERIDAESRLISNMTGRLGAGNDMLILSDMFLWEVIMQASPGLDPLNTEVDEFHNFLLLSSLFWNSFSETSSGNYYFKPVLFHNKILNSIDDGAYTYVKMLTQNNKLWKSILWSGPVMYPDFVDRSDLFAYTRTFSFKPSLYDQTLTIRKSNRLYRGYPSLYPGKALLSSLFEAFDTDISGISPDELNEEIFVKVNGNSPIDMIRAATAMDFLWNPSSYSPEMSTYKVLLYLFDKSYADELVYFNNLYFRLMAVCIDLESNGFAQRAVKLGDELIIQMNYHWDNLQGLSQDYLMLLNDLNDLKNSVISRFYKAREIPPGNPQ